MQKMKRFLSATALTAAVFTMTTLMASAAQPGGALSGKGGIQSATNTRQSAYEQVQVVHAFDTVVGIGNEGFKDVATKDTDLWEGAAAGTKYWSGTVDGGKASIWMDFNELQALPEGNLDDMYLSFKVKISDLSKQNDALFRLRKTVDGDGTGFGWWYGDLINKDPSFNNKWQEMLLPLKFVQGDKSWVSGGTKPSDFGAYKQLSFLINQWGTGEFTCSIADIKIVKPAITGDYTYETKDPEGTTVIQIDSCDGVGKQQLWTGKREAAVSPTPVVGTQGNGGFSFNLKPNTNLEDNKSGIVFNHEVFLANLPADNEYVADGGITLDSFQTAFLSFDMFVEDKTKINPESLEVSVCYTTGVWEDNNCINWIIDETKLNNGWNHILLPFNAAQSEVDLGYGTVELRGEVDIFNSLRISVEPTADMNVQLDNINFIGMTEKLDKDPVVPGEDPDEKPDDKPATGVPFAFPAVLLAGVALGTAVVTGRKHRNS